MAALEERELEYILGACERSSAVIRRPSSTTSDP
jgi:hypothetical protein